MALSNTEMGAESVALSGTDAFIRSSTEGRSNPTRGDAVLFFKTLLDNLRDGAIFVDGTGKIKVWNCALERLTGISCRNVIGKPFGPSLLRLAESEEGETETVQDMLQKCLSTGTKQSGEFGVTGQSGCESRCEMIFAPVQQADGTVEGAVILLYDASVQTNLKRQLRDLYEFSVLDPLTQVANRAEFERVLDQCLRLSHVSDFQCSIIICDIDFFKSINDNYNHHIGDQALVAFAQTLKQFVRSEDLVARFGGEEFVILCANCDSASAAQRAEEIRVTLTKTPQPMLDGKCITASFGVAQLQEDDSATDFFVRADTALLKAKETGRNRVVEATIGAQGKTSKLKNTSASSLSGVKWRTIKGRSLVSQEYQTSTPMQVLVEKLRGYIIDTDADIRRVEDDFATLWVHVEDPKNPGRKGNFIVDVEFEPCESNPQDSPSHRSRISTYIRITIREGRRKWFAPNSNGLVDQVLKELREYLTINDAESQLTVDRAATESGREPAPKR